VPTASEQVDDGPGEDIDPMDALLDKISESGMESLSAEERAQLDELSRRRRER